MLTRIKNLFRDSSLYFAFLCTAGIAFLSLVKIPSDKLDMVSSDKLMHGIAYFFLTFFWLLGMNKPKFKYVKIWWILLGCFIYGIIIEVLQAAITSYRTASYLDILANSAGIMAAFIVFLGLKKKFS